MIDAKKIDACPVCTTPCTIEGHTTKHYKPIPRELDVKKIVRILEKRHNEPYTQHTGFPAKFMHYARAFRDAYTSGLLWEDEK